MVTPRVTRAGTIRLTSNHWIVWRPEPYQPPEPLPDEWVFRQLVDADLDDPAWLLAMLDRRGMVWGGLDRVRDDETTPAELAYPPLPPRDDPHAGIHLAVVREQLLTLRTLARQAPPTFAEADAFWRLIDKGLTPFTPAAIARDALLVDLYEAACWQIYLAATDGVPPRRCRNEPCGRVFYRKDGDSPRTADVAYCSETCRQAAKQRRYRARNRARIIDH